MHTCEVCFRTFSRKDSLSRHLVTIHEKYVRGVMPPINIKRRTDTFDDNFNAAKRNVPMKNFSEFEFRPKKTPKSFINVSSPNGTDEKYHGLKLYDETVVQWKHPFTCKYYFAIVTKTL